MIDHDDLKTLRKHLNMTQSEMAYVMSISRRYYQLLEYGSYPMSKKNCRDLLEYLNNCHEDLTDVAEIIDCLGRVK